MMSHADEPRSFFHRLSALWQQWQSTKKPASRLMQRDHFQRTGTPINSVLKPLRAMSADGWRALAADNRDRMENFKHDPDKHAFYEMEAKRCDAEAKKIEDAEAGE